MPERGENGTGRRGGKLAAVLCALACAAAPGAAAAQELGARPPGGDAGPAPADPSAAGPPPFRASGHLPLGHWAYPLIDRWIVAGWADGLSPWLRPYRRLEVARVVRRLRDSGRREGEANGWLTRLATELAPELRFLGSAGGTDEAGGDGGEPRLDARAVAGATFATQGHRDPLRPVLEGPYAEDRLLEHAFLEAGGHAGPVAGGLRVGRDGIFRRDPQFPDGRVVPDANAPVLDELGVRVEEGWLELQSRYASVFFGRAYRDWSAPGPAPGLLRSDYAYSYEEVAYRVGVDRLFLTGTFAPLPDAAGDTARYLATHRLEARPWDWLSVAVTEAVLHGGPDRRLDPRLVNPLGIWHIVEDDVGNAVGQVDVWVRPVDGLALFGSLLVDGTNTPRVTNACCGLGGTVGAAAAVGRGWTATATVTALQSLVYRSNLPWDFWTVDGLGLGWDLTDALRATAEASWLGPDGLLLEPRLDLQVRGQGDIRELRPGQDSLPGHPRFLVGETETTVRPAVAGAWRPAAAPWLDLRWDVGVNFIDDPGHRAGRSRVPFVASVRATFRSPALPVLGG